ncbi:TPA: type 1 fimbrial protein [Salmonella enterica subsp. enterica serovar Eastbourne]|nr:type 1 fimbrial protein [Salmonella enterica subsp. enterica serovar Eastbourne]
MKIKNRLFLLGAAMAVMSSSAFAATTGTQTFTANVTADTCTITGLNQTRDLGNLLKSQFATAWASSSNYSNDFNVANCPTTFTKVKVTPTYTASKQYAWVVENAGTAKGVHLNTQTKASDPDMWQNGTAKEFALNNGAAVVPLNFKIERNNTDAVSDGTLDFQMAFAFDFE